MREVELYAALISPFLKRLGRELGSVVHGDRGRRAGALDERIEHLRDVAVTCQWNIGPPEAS